MRSSGHFYSEIFVFPNRRQNNGLGILKVALREVGTNFMIKNEKEIVKPEFSHVAHCFLPLGSMVCFNRD